LSTSAAWAQNQSPTFSWILPKTILDITVAYEFADCVKIGGIKSYRIKVTPTVAARGVPDPKPGLRTQSTGALKDGWEDRNLTITTFANSHILNTVSAHPVGEASQTIGNVLTGIGKFVAIALGVGATQAGEAETKCDDADNPGLKINQYKDQIQTVQVKLAGDNVTDAQQKQYTSQIQALQALLQQEQAKMSFTLKATIDPGYTDSKNTLAGIDAPPPAAPLPSPPPQGIGAVAKDGLIATLVPTTAQMKGIAWAEGLDPNLGPAKLKVVVYMDFANSIPTKELAEGSYQPTQVGSHANALTYRDVAYIPILVWYGASNRAPNAQLLANNRLPFAQYGQEQVLPLSAGAFGDVTLSLTFSEMGEETNSSFTSKSLYSNATSLFTSVASTANSIATDVRSANTSQATALQNQADAIYQGNRLAVCQSNPANCPSK
jgi:hypothetical protein